MSLTCFSIESFGDVAAAIPPWAFSVALSESSFFVIKRTFPYLDAVSAKFSPAAPEPTIKNLADCNSDFMIIREVFLNFCKEFVCKFV